MVKRLSKKSGNILDLELNPDPTKLCTVIPAFLRDSRIATPSMAGASASSPRGFSPDAFVALLGLNRRRLEKTYREKGMCYK